MRKATREGALRLRRAPDWITVPASVLTLLLVACAHAPHAAAPPGGQAPALSATSESSATPPMNASIDKVSVDLVVRTKHHKPVLDLETSQLAVTDDGSPIHLSSLRRVDPASGSQHLVAFVFDRLNTAAAKAARRTAEKILGVIPDEGYSLAVLQVNGRLRLLQTYTQDFRLADTAVADATPALPLPPAATLTPAEKTLIASAHSDALTLNPEGRAEGRLLLSALQQSQRILEDRHSYPSLAALLALVRSDRLLPGRKFIFYFASGIAADSDARERLQSIVGQANQAGVTIYIVDTGPATASMSSAMQASAASSILGNAGNGGNNAFGAGTSGPGVQGAALGSALAHNVAGFEFGSVDVDQSPLAALASGTGGMYINAFGGSKNELRQLHEDLTTWYQASWVSPAKRDEGQFRPISIRSTRKDLLIRARSGYFAVPSEDSSETLPFEVPLLKILAGSSLPSDIAIHAGVLRLGELADGNSAELVVQVPVSELETHEDGNTGIASVHASLLAVVKNSKGAVLQSFGEDFPLHEAADVFHRDSGQTITLERHFSAAPGVYKLEALVMDRLANKAGAERSTFTIEPPPQGPSLSDIALVQSIEPVEENTETFEPMRYLDGRVIPNFATDLPGKTNALQLFFILHPIAGSLIQPVLRMQIFHNSRLLAEMPMELHKVSGTDAVVPYLATLHGGVFPPGNYEIKVLLSQDGSKASSDASFRVEGSSAASNSSEDSLKNANALSSDQTDPGLLSKAFTANSRFVLTRSTNPVPPPTHAEIQSMIEDARQRALAWSGTLRNFLCLEFTNHFVPATGEAGWKQKGTLVELMRYVDHEQTRTTLLLNGERSSVQPDQLEFDHSNGEFGAMFHVIFDPSAKTIFTWKQSSFLDGQPIQIFAFQVARAHSGFNLYDRDNHTRPVGFHGLLYLDPATRSIRRVSIVADDIPPALLIHACSVSVDYSWISMQNHDFLLPVRGAVILQETRRHPVLNEFDFRNYHRFGSRVHILTADELKALSQN